MVRKRYSYIRRWRKEHPLLQMYLNKEQYELIKKLAMESNKTMKDVVLEAINRLVDFEKWKREYELRIAELSRELRGRESEVSMLKSKVDALKKIVNGVYDCIASRKREVCRSVCVDVKDFVYSHGMYSIKYNDIVLDVDWNCFKKLGL
jgi:hypothetical protein